MPPTPALAALSPPLTHTPPGLVVVVDGAKWVVAIRDGDAGWFVCAREPAGLVARWRFRVQRLAIETCKELVRGERR